MADTVFVDQSNATPVVAAWLNDLNNLRYGNSDATRGSALLQFLQAGTGAVVRTTQNKNRDIIHAADFGVVGDGVTDDTAAINLAKTAATGKTLHISGTPLITSTLTFSVNNNCKLVFDGPSRTNDGNSFGSHFIKAASMTTPCVLITASNFTAEGGGVTAVVGNTGDNIVINGVNCIWRNGISTFAGRDGVRIGSDTGANSNGFCLENFISSNNSRYGFNIHDSGSNANAGLLIKPQCQSNTSDGIYLDRASANTIISPLSETNTGYGLHLATHATSNTIVGGDCEANTAGDIIIDALVTPGGSSIINTITGAGTSITNNEPTTFIVQGSNANLAWTATLTGVVGTVTKSAFATIVGHNVTIDIPPSGNQTSNATTKSYTGLPLAARPVVQKRGLVIISDNGGTNAVGMFTIQTSGVIDIYIDPNGSAWTGSGTAKIFELIFAYTLD